MESSITVGPASLSDEQQKDLNKQKRAVRINNEKYFRCHPELRTMIKAFMAALVEQKPDDPAAFACEFFGDPELARRLGYDGWTRPDTPVDDASGPSDGSLVPATTGDQTEDLERLLIHLFTEADADRSGQLDHNEFRTLMLTADLGLEPADIKLLLSEVDEDENGNIAYAEFVPLAVEVVQTLRFKQKVKTHVAARGGEFLFNGMTRPAMEAALKAAFAQVDGAGAGALPRLDVKRVLRHPSLGLTKKQVQMLMMSVDDSSADLTLAQLLPLLDVLVEVAQAEQRRHDLGDAGQELSEACAKAAGGAGALPLSTLKDLLCNLFPSLSLLQVNAILGEAKPDTAGLVLWEGFLPTAALMVRGFCDPRAVEERAKVAMRANFEPVELMNGRDAEMLHKMLMDLFLEHDSDGNGSLDLAEFEECLKSTSLGFSDEDVKTLMQVADADAAGRVTYEQFTMLAYDVLLYVARERAIGAEVEKDRAAEKVQAIAKGRKVRKGKA